LDPKLRNTLRSFGALQLGQNISMPQDGLVSKVTQKADTTYSILLAEHLQRIVDEEVKTDEEFLSEFPKGQTNISLDIEALIKEVAERFDELRSKWKQRFSHAEVLKIIQSNQWLEPVPDGFKLRNSTKKKDVRDKFYQSFHILVGDIEKIVVMTGSRLNHIQERMAKAWHSQLPEGSGVRLLPTLELILRKAESDSMASLRKALGEMALKLFTDGLKESKNVKFSSERSTVIRLGEMWNPRAKYDNNFQGFTHLFSNLAESMCYQQCEFYQAKWHLFFRGYSSGQINLFNPTPEYPQKGAESVEGVQSESDSD
jgi:hypothetical protein